jgi:hypothetical protein
MQEEEKENEKQQIVDSYLSSLLPGLDSHLLQCVISYEVIDWSQLLQFACQEADMRLIQYSVNQGADICWMSIDNVCKVGNWQLMEYMIELTRENYGETEKVYINLLNGGMVGATVGNQFSIIQHLVKKGANDFDVAFGVACQESYWEIIHFLRPNVSEDGLRTALIKVCRCGHKDMVLWLIQEGASDANTGWRRAFEHACFSGNHELVELMIEKGATNWLNGFMALCDGERSARTKEDNSNCLYINVVKYLIERMPMRELNQAIRYFHYENNIQILEMLIEKAGSSIDVPEKHICLLLNAGLPVSLFFPKNDHKTDIEEKGTFVLTTSHKSTVEEKGHFVMTSSPGRNQYLNRVLELRKQIIQVVQECFTNIFCRDLLNLFFLFICYEQPQ